MEFDSIDYSITPDTNQDIQRKSLKYNQIMETSKPDSKNTIEEQYKKQAEVFPGWNDIDRIDASKIWK